MSFVRPRCLGALPFKNIKLWNYDIWRIWQRSAMRIPPQQPDNTMPRFFFDIHNGTWSHDEDGVECMNVAEACLQAKRALPEMALDQVLCDGDHQTITVFVTDEERQPVYTATLAFTGRAMNELGLPPRHQQIKN
jgi:hypothetical protein